MTGTITIHYDSADRIERLEAAAIVRGDGERLRGVLRALDEALRLVARGKADCIGDAALDYAQAEALRDWLREELEDIPLSLDC